MDTGTTERDENKFSLLWPCFYHTSYSDKNNFILTLGESGTIWQLKWITRIIFLH